MLFIYTSFFLNLVLQKKDSLYCVQTFSSYFLQTIASQVGSSKITCFCMCGKLEVWRHSKCDIFDNINTFSERALSKKITTRWQLFFHIIIKMECTLIHMAHLDHLLTRKFHFPIFIIFKTKTCKVLLPMFKPTKDIRKSYPVMPVFFLVIADIETEVDGILSLDSI